MALDLSKITGSMPANIYHDTSFSLKKKFDLYPSTTWGAKLLFNSATGHLAITATVEAGWFRFETTEFASDDNESFLGDVEWFIEVDDGTEEYIVAQGVVKVWPNPDGDEATDFRSDVKKSLDAVNAVIVGGSLTDEVSSYTIATSQGSRSVTRIPRTELMEIRRDLRAEYREELRIMKSVSGRKRGNSVKSATSRAI